MARNLQRALVIACAGAVLGLAANLISPRRIPYITAPKVAPLPADFIPLAEAKQLWQAGATFFLDARAPADYATGHIAGAYNLPAEEFDARYPQIATMLTPDTAIVTYCDGLQCDLSHHLTARLRQLHYQNVRVLQNGWTAWHQAGFATTTGDKP